MQNIKQSVFVVMALHFPTFTTETFEVWNYGSYLVTESRGQ